MSNQTLTFPPSEGFRPHVGAALTAFFSVYELTREEFARLAARCDQASQPPAVSLDDASTAAAIYAQPSWNRLPAPVTLATPLRAETFQLAHPLFRRLRDLTQGDCALAGISEGGRAFTSASVAAIELYLRYGGFSALTRATGDSILTAATWRDLTRQIIRCEFA